MARGGYRIPDGLLSVVDRDALDRAFRRLTVEQRAVSVLHHHVVLPLTEIADAVGFPGRDCSLEIYSQS